MEPTGGDLFFVFRRFPFLVVFLFIDPFKGAPIDPFKGLPIVEKLRQNCQHLEMKK